MINTSILYVYLFLYTQSNVQDYIYKMVESYIYLIMQEPLQNLYVVTGSYYVETK